MERRQTRSMVGLAGGGPRAVVAHIAVADAVCYMLRYAGVILFCHRIAPALLKIDLKMEALKLERSWAWTAPNQAWHPPGVNSSCAPTDWLRIPLWPDYPSLLPSGSARASRVYPPVAPGRMHLENRADMTLEAGDVIALSGPRQVIVEVSGRRAEEVEDKDLLDVRSRPPTSS